jgi:4-hydroxy-3-polyprenylbenzoate decarboxylase
VTGPTTGRGGASQDLHDWWDAYRRRHPDDVLTAEGLGADQDVTAVCVALEREGRRPVVWCPEVEGLDGPVLTNVFASRERIARVVGAADEASIHAVVRRGIADRLRPSIVADGPALADVTEGDGVDLARIPMLRHFAEDAAPYLTSAVVVAEDPDTGVGNLSYHRCMVRGRTGLATSLHSRGDLFRALRAAEARGEVLPVAVVIGGHPLWLLAASARVAADVDERDVAGGLFGAPLECVRTPRHGLAVPASAEWVLEGVIDPGARVDEGPFGEYSGYASARSTNNLVEVQAICRRADPILLDVVSGHAPDHLNLGRIPREADLVGKLQDRFPDVVAVHYPPAGTHFHCVVAVRRGAAAGLARQVLLAVLGLDPYVKLAVAVDDDVDVRRDEEVTWALATRFQADRDAVIVANLPGSMLDPSSAMGITARLALDATMAPGFDAVRISLSERAMDAARRVLAESGRQGCARDAAPPRPGG